MSAPRDIAIVCEWPTLNGGERSMLSTLDGVRAAGFLPWAIAPSQGPLAQALIEQGVELVPLDWRDPQQRRRPQAELREALHAILDRRRPRLLHANSLACGVLSGPVAAACKLPSISHLRDIIKLSRQAIADLNQHTRLLAVSDATRMHHIAQGLDAGKAHTLHNGVDLSRFRPRPPTGYLHRELALPGDALLVGVIGQLGLRKGQDTLLAAAEMSGSSGSNVHYLIVGQQDSGKDESTRYVRNLQQRAAQSLAGRVHFLGTRSDVDQLMNELTLFVHPARQEPLGRVLLEAAASGATIVATDVGGTREIFPAESSAAWLVPPDDRQALANAIGTLLDDSDRRCAMSTAARRRAEEAFDIRAAVTNLIAHYRAVM